MCICISIRFPAIWLEVASWGEDNLIRMIRINAGDSKAPVYSELEEAGTPVWLHQVEWDSHHHGQVQRLLEKIIILKQGKDGVIKQEEDLEDRN